MAPDKKQISKKSMDAAQFFVDEALIRSGGGNRQGVENLDHDMTDAGRALVRLIARELDDTKE